MTKVAPTVDTFDGYDEYVFRMSGQVSAYVRKGLVVDATHQSLMLTLLEDCTPSDLASVHQWSATQQHEASALELYDGMIKWENTG